MYLTPFISPNSASTSVIIPKTTKLGTYYLGGCADATNTQPESNESNNCALNATPLTITQNQAPTISLSSDKTTSDAPAIIVLSANASDTDGSISKVEYYNGTTLLGSSTTAPHSYTWSDIPAGNYSVTAKATDNIGATATSAAVSITVLNNGLQMYFIHTDHLDTPRVITDTTGNVVWEWQNADPFGNNPANENPSGLGQFEFPLRFAGQYQDKETGNNYNYFRDYNPATGRYVQSDPIGLAGGLNTFLYVGGNPLGFADFLGLSPEDVKKILEVHHKYVNDLTDAGLRTHPLWNNYTRNNEGDELLSRDPKAERPVPFDPNKKG